MVKALTGDKALDRAIHELGASGARRVASACIRKALQVVAKGMKAKIPPKLKKAKRGIGSRFKKASKKGSVTAKAGYGVGISKKRRAKMENKGRGKRPGVGAGANNLHWFVLGTGNRATKSHSTGKMQPLIPTALRDGYAASEPAASAAILEMARKQLAKEAAKAAAKTLKK